MQRRKKIKRLKYLRLKLQLMVKIRMPLIKNLLRVRRAVRSLRRVEVSRKMKRKIVIMTTAMMMIIIARMMKMSKVGLQQSMRTRSRRRSRLALILHPS